MKVIKMMFQTVRHNNSLNKLSTSATCFGLKNHHQDTEIQKFVKGKYRSSGL
jgi:hypothetical protein